jgi:hypothetical protein
MAAPVAPLPGLRQAIGPSNPALSKVVVSSYEGERDERGRFVGQGTATFKHGHAYAGAFADGWMHGQGKFSWADGTTFEGDFVRNTIDGNGRYDWADGSYYEGEVRGGIRHGRGCMQVASRRRPRHSFGASMKMAFTSKEEEEAEAEGGPDDDYEEIPGPYYEGDWKLGKRHGEGTLWYGGKDSPSFFKGTWVDGMREGPRGEMVYPSGNRYLGAWQADRRHGKGVMRLLTTEEIYDGDWKEGLQHGAGTHTWLAGGRAEHGATQRLMCNRYVGEWMVGLRHGKGTFYYSNGSRYVGEFQRNLKAGHGVYTFPDGRVYEGPFTDDRMGFNDGSLEEKVATRGPVKIESSRKGTKKKKKKKRKGLPQRTPRAVPLAGTTRNVHLNIGDLMSGLAPKERGVERRGIEKLVMRWNSGMKQIYAHYSTLSQNGLPKRGAGSSTGGVGEQEEEFYLNQGQFWLLMRDCGIVSQAVPLASLARIFSTVKLQFASSIAESRRRREATEAGVDEGRTATVDDRLYLEPDDPVHEPQRPILYREFVEGLVRIAAVVYEDDASATTLPAKFSRLLDGPVRQNSRTSVAAAGGKSGGGRSPKIGGSGPADAVTAAMAKKDLLEWLSRPDVSAGLRAVFDKYSHAGFGGKHDKAMYTREFAALLRGAGLVRGNKAVEDEASDLLTILQAVLVFPSATFGSSTSAAEEKSGAERPETSRFDPEDDTTNFEIEMIFLEFVETLARVAHAHWHPILLARQTKEDEVAAASAAEESAVDAEAEGEAEAPAEEDAAAAAAAEGEEGAEDADAEGDAEAEAEQDEDEEEEEEEEENPNRLKEDTTVLAAMQRMCDGWIFKLL